MAKRNRFVLHEGPAWLITLLWLFAVSGLVLWKGLPYDPTAKLGLEDWANIGTFLSAVIAPIAVLWVVRSFYVQKKELAAAVQAATDQVTALRQQYELDVEKKNREIRPDLRFDLNLNVTKTHPTYADETGIAALEEFQFEFKNAGRGSAYDAVVTITGIGKNYDWTDTAWRKSLLKVDDFFTFEYLHNQCLNEPATEHYVISVLCRDSEQGWWTRYYAIDAKTHTRLEIHGDVNAHIQRLRGEGTS